MYTAWRLRGGPFVIFPSPPRSPALQVLKADDCIGAAVEAKLKELKKGEVGGWALLGAWGGPGWALLGSKRYVGGVAFVPNWATTLPVVCCATSNFELS